jgi:hypothetical protein
MSLDRVELKQLLSRMVFDETLPEDWVQDVWGLSPMLGDSAAKLWQMLEMLMENCSDEMLEQFLQSLYSSQYFESQDTDPHHADRN